MSIRDVALVTGRAISYIALMPIGSSHV